MAVKKIAIVYDWIDKWGGVERVLLTLHEMFPQAEFFTSYYDEISASWAKDLNIHTSFIQKFPNFIKKSRIASFPFYLYAFESFDFTGFDVVISITSSFAKSIITRPETLHICYLLTPTRYLWVEPETYLQDTYEPLRIVLPKIREWDYIAAQRPDKIIAISETVRKRTKKFYRRESEVIYPPFDEEYWKRIKFEIRNSKFEANSKFKILHSKFFLMVSRLEPYKRIDIAVNTFNSLPELNLVIIGKGSEEERLKANAKNNITFLKDLTDQNLALLYKNAQALIIPQQEDYGYIALEAQYFGCPVIAFHRGGVTETVIDGKTGIFFDKQTARSLQAAVERFSKISYNLRKATAKFGVEELAKFSKKEFMKRFMSHVTRYTNK